mmetsp:Transcript_42394/g.55892  ORF Transcript_42394/g.55892 Transcript_42394/m.55892 type:complete len:156 (-) Transcript_42394:477-944(-)
MIFGQVSDSITNTLNDNFFYSSFDKVVNTTSMSVIEAKDQEDKAKFYAKYSIGGELISKKSRTIWYCTGFLEFLATFGGLATSVLAGASVLVTSFESHEQSRAMLLRLYWHAEGEERVKKDSDIQYGAYYATKSFEEHVRGRRELDNSYISALFY